MAGLLGVLLNPTVICLLAFVWVGTSVYHGVTEWINERQLVRVVTQPWAAAVSQRDTAAKFKDEIIVAVSKDKERTDDQIQKLRDQLEKSEAARRLAGVPDCVWSADDRRMLNRGLARTTRN